MLLKYHLFFTLIYCPLAPSPLVPRQVIRSLWAALASEGHRTAAQEACSGPAFLQNALYVSAVICSAFSLWTGQVLRDTGSLPPPTEALKLCSQPQRNRLERQGPLETNLEETASRYLKVLTRAYSRRTTTNIPKQNNLLFQEPQALKPEIISLLTESELLVSLSLQIAKITEDSKFTNS